MTKCKRADGLVLGDIIVWSSSKEEEVKSILRLGGYVSINSRTPLMCPETLVTVKDITDGWLPIETVPKDEEVLISGGTHGSSGVCEFHNVEFKHIALATYDFSDKCWEDGTGCYYHPTHWMPAPKPVGG